jgi:hypothetical protein
LDNSGLLSIVTADPFFMVEIQTRSGQWFEDQRNEALWVMRAYASNLIANRPDLAGRVRIVRCHPLPSSVI